MNKIIIATKNAGKLKEFKAFFEQYDMTAYGLDELDKQFDDVEETGTTFEENAALKAETIAGFLQVPVLADDSGLEIDALEGRPGVYSARYAGEAKSDQANMDKVLEELQGVPAAERTARFVCVLAVSQPGKETFYARGHVEGVITEVPQGEHGFGYDPVFQPEGYEKTMAQLEPAEKNQISHRKQAMVHLEKWLNEQAK
ncbi:XTP/dITP diphosphohydrolase [Terribacillus aidingensis]|uniref:dITP/XTP pyrophosphatase n=1 Tax=Terribacillus aidingensis TaxID=586416 RepID=A0A285NPT2_9BACI|nr:XTP/dITP diphosphatase [Terribacillus aidingensis]SNZ11540.1 XTP/dITP diphosphohydrolase [Terribacillus aidingensis]